MSPRLPDYSSDSFFCLPVGVSSWISSAIQVIYLCLSLSLKGLFKQTSKGCRREVSLPGITDKSVFSDFSDCFTSSFLCASKESNTSRLLRRLRPPIWARQIFSIQIFMVSLPIQPFSWTVTTMPRLFWIFDMVLDLKMTSCFSLEPSPAHARTTVRWFFSLPVVLIFTVLSPTALTVRFDGMSKWTQTSSMFPTSWRG